LLYLSGPSLTLKGPSHGPTSLWFRPILCTYGEDFRVTSVVPGIIGGPSFLLFSLVVVWRALAFLSAVLASCWFLVICVAISSAAGTAVGETLTLGRRLMIRPKVISKGDSSVLSLGAALIALWTCGWWRTHFDPFGPM